MSDHTIPYPETSSTNSAKKYPSPFFDLSQTYVPKRIKALFPMCRNFYLKNDLLHTIINKLTEYPITDLLFESLDPDQKLDSNVKDKYRESFYHIWKIKELLVEIGIDYHVFGNCFLSINRRFTRYLTCPSCKEKHEIRSYTDKELKFSDFTYRGICKKCKTDVKFAVKDVYRTNAESLHFVRWSPESIHIEHDPMTGDSDYFFIIDASTREKVMTGVRRTIDRLPWIYITSLKDKKKIQLDSKNLYHFKQPGMAESWVDGGWGMPAILPAMSLIWYMQTLRRANETIATEHIVPRRVIFPAGNGSLDPYTSLNLGKWRYQVREQLENWKQDANHIGIFPIPMGYQKLGGDARMHLVTPEIKAIEESIARSMGVPWEFIAGGATWTGSSISLRIIENHFLSYREMLLDFINYFLLPNVKVATGWMGIKAKFKDFRMSDDAETKSLMANLNASGKLSDSGLLDRLGIDSEADRKLKLDDLSFMNEMTDLNTKAQAKTQADSQTIANRGQARSEWAYLDEKAKITEKEFENELAKEQSKVLKDGAGDPFEVINKYAVSIYYADPATQQYYLKELATKLPVTYAAVMKRIPLIAQSMIPNNEMAAEPASEESGGDSQEKKKQAKPKEEKHKGQSSGTP